MSKKELLNIPTAFRLLSETFLGIKGQRKPFTQNHYV